MGSPKGPGAKDRKALWERHLEQTRVYTQAEQDSLWPIASETFIASFDDAEDLGASEGWRTRKAGRRERERERAGAGGRPPRRALSSTHIVSLHHSLLSHREA